MQNYSAMSWYWVVAGSTTQVFSGATLTYVPVADVDYAAWQAQHTATNIVSASELFEVMLAQWIPVYLGQGMQLESTGSPSLNGTYPMDDQTQGQITGIATSIAAGRGLPGGDSTFFFQGHVFNEAQFLDFAAASGSFVYGVYQSVGQMVLAGSGSLPAQPVVIA